MVDSNADSKGTILITGASAGLGEEMARQFAALGYDLALCARRLERLEALRREIHDAHPDRRVEIRSLDVIDDTAVFAVFKAFRDDFGTLEKVIVNAGLGKGQPLGTGRYDANKQTALTNFIGALAQTEAAMEIFRAQGNGHLVMVSSMSAMRGMPRNMTTYAATKAGVAHLIEGLRVELAASKSDIDLTVLYPGFIASEMNDKAHGSTPPLMVSTEKGVRSMVSAIEKRVADACVPPLPWGPMSLVMKHAPMPIYRRIV